MQVMLKLNTGPGGGGGGGHSYENDRGCLSSCLGVEIIDSGLTQVVQNETLSNIFSCQGIF